MKATTKATDKSGIKSIDKPKSPSVVKKQTTTPKKDSPTGWKKPNASASPNKEQNDKEKPAAKKSITVVNAEAKSKSEKKENINASATTVDDKLPKAKKSPAKAVKAKVVDDKTVKSAPAAQKEKEKDTLNQK